MRSLSRRGLSLRTVLSAQDAALPVDLRDRTRSPDRFQRAQIRKSLVGGSTASPEFRSCQIIFFGYRLCRIAASAAQWEAQIIDERRVALAAGPRRDFGAPAKCGCRDEALHY